MPCSPTARLHVNLKACCCCCCFPLLFFFFFTFLFLIFPYAWQILNQKRLGNSTPRSCQQSTCEVNLIDGKGATKAGAGGSGGGGGVNKWMRDSGGVLDHPYHQLISSASLAGFSPTRLFESSHLRGLKHANVRDSLCTEVQLQVWKSSIW